MAFQGVDLRDLFRPDSGLTLRRLWALIRALPWDAPLRVALREQTEQAQKATPDAIRSRAAEWEARNAAQRAKEAGDD